MLWKVGLFSTPSDDRNTLSIVSLFVVANKINSLPSETKMATPTLKVLLTKSR